MSTAKKKTGTRLQAAKNSGKAPARKAAKATKRVVSDKDGSAEEKIKEAARKLFTLQGFAATRTRDIAQEAGINLALLNYYFRSKEKLFDIIMMENFQEFIQGIRINLRDETTSIDEKVTLLTASYIDFLSRQPDLPLFLLNEMRGKHSDSLKKLDMEVSPLSSHLMKQVAEAGAAGKIAPIDPFHFVANLVGLTVFPFVARAALQKITHTTDERFMSYMQERKQLIPMWIRKILEAG